MAKATGRAVIVYASAWLNYGRGAASLSVEGSDVHAMMEVCHGLEPKKLDLILHSPGGNAQAAEQVIEYLRTQFDHIRAIVPLQAKSAATMMALGADEIVLGKHSELGPIDPQIIMTTPEGQRLAPAHALLRDFKRAKDECAADVSALAAWTPILRSYIGLLDYCQQQIDLSMDVVEGWLDRYMLRDPTLKLTDDARKKKAREIAEYFGSDAAYQRFRTHSRPVRYDELDRIGLRVTPLEKNKTLQEHVLSVYHATDLTLREPVAKIVENNLGKRHVKMEGRIQVAQVVPPPPGKPQK